MLIKGGRDYKQDGGGSQPVVILTPGTAPGSKQQKVGPVCIL